MAALVVVAVAMASPPSGWATCGGLSNAYSHTACPGNMTCCKQGYDSKSTQTTSVSMSSVAPRIMLINMDA
jgi:hypothetical protein